jgi:hypothetical protein
MPAPGSLTITLRFPKVGSLAAGAALRAGWSATVIGDEWATQKVFEFTRYVGVDRPNGDLQAAHFAHLEGALSNAGFGDFERVANGVVVDGHINPLSAAALLAAATTAQGRAELLASAPRVEDAVFEGTCFAFRHSNVYLTAAHCVDGVPDGMLFINSPPAGDFFEVARVHRHEAADLALLELGDDVWPGAVEPFINYSDTPALGTEFMAYGFPEDAPDLGSNERRPMARLFRGHFQRVLRDQRRPYNYAAGEMSIPSPVGLSGGPLFRPEHFNTVISVATGNVQSRTYVGRVEETEAAGVTERHTVEDIVQYGIAALLAPVADWLDALAPVQPRLPPSVSE